MYTCTVAYTWWKVAFYKAPEKHGHVYLVGLYLKIWRLWKRSQFYSCWRQASFQARKNMYNFRCEHKIFFKIWRGGLSCQQAAPPFIAWPPFIYHQSFYLIELYWLKSYKSLQDIRLNYCDCEKIPTLTLQPQNNVDLDLFTFERNFFRWLMVSKQNTRSWKSCSSINRLVIRRDIIPTI